MNLLTVPLTAQLIKKINTLVESGVAESKAALARQALERYVEELAVAAVLRAEREVAEGKTLWAI